VKKSPYFWGTYGGFGLGSLLGIAAVAAFIASEDAYRSEDLLIALGIALVFFALLLSLVLPTVAMAVLVYKMWSSLPAEHRRTGPGAAVGFLFIPFFNLYWVFQAYPGFATDYNKYVSHVDPNARRLSEGPFITIAILSVFSAIPYIGVLAALPSLIVLGFVISAACDAVSTLRALSAAGVEAAGGGETAAPLAASTAPPTDRGSTALGVFALVLIFWPVAWAAVSFFGERMEVDFLVLLTVFRVLRLISAAIPIAMGFFVRNLGLRIAVFVLGGLNWLWQLYAVIREHLDERYYY
jgi:hypothetical protein